jgi:lipopolysaccharide transport system permease protein
LNGLIRDVTSALTVITTFGMFLAPVIYPPPMAWPQGAVNYLNPISPFMAAARELAVGATLSQPKMRAVASLFCLLVFAAGWRIFRLVMPRVLERL